MIQRNTHNTTAREPAVLVTGATGFIGHYTLAELLRSGQRCAALLRSPMAGSRQRLAGLLAALGVDLDEQARVGRLLLWEGDLNGTLPRGLGVQVDRVLHVAACTDFDPTPNGDPWRTNVLGTRRLLHWSASRGVGSFHLVSSAYQCGHQTAAVPERIAAGTGCFHNAYEQSKRQAELDAQRWASNRGALLTVYRPSIVVGDTVSGRATSFGGFYLLARATQLVSQQYNADDTARHQTGIRLLGDGAAAQNLVPVDYVARMVATGVTNSRHAGKVYHLTHPHPPTNNEIKQAVDTFFDVAGSRFVPPQEMTRSTLSALEQHFYDGCRPVRAYLTDTPSFHRRNCLFLEFASGARCPRYDAEHFHRLLDYATGTRWGRRTQRKATASAGPSHEHDPQVATYFDAYLPRMVDHSEVARQTAMTVTMCFVLTDMPWGAWRCAFVAGQLSQCTRHDREADVPGPVDFTYRTTRHVFWDAVAGRVDPQAVFMRQLATVEGDLESALKTAFVLHRFNREFPCTPETLRHWSTRGPGSDMATTLTGTQDG